VNCQDLVELVTDYLEGALDPATRARFEEHLVECEYCAIYLEQMRQTLVVAGRIAPEGLDPQTRANLLAAFRTWSDRRPG
jgi:anti-sigma factor RsiW